MAETKKQSDWGCLYLIAAPVVLALLADGHGDWIVGGVTVFFIVILIIVTGAEIVGSLTLPSWLHRKRQPPPGAGPEGG